MFIFYIQYILIAREKIPSIHFPEIIAGIFEIFFHFTHFSRRFWLGFSWSFCEIFVYFPKNSIWKFRNIKINNFEGITRKLQFSRKTGNKKKLHGNSMEFFPIFRIFLENYDWGFCGIFVDFFLIFRILFENPSSSFRGITVIFFNFPYFFQKLQLKFPWNFRIFSTQITLGNFELVKKINGNSVEIPDGIFEREKEI